MSSRDPGFWRDIGLTCLAVLPLAATALLAATGLASGPELWLLVALALLWLSWRLTVASSRRARQLRFLTSLVQALREGEYGLRASLEGSPLQEVAREINALAAHLDGKERRSLEADALLSQLLSAVELAVVVVNAQDRLVEMNPAAEQLLGGVAIDTIGRPAAELGLSGWLERPAPFIDSQHFPGGDGPWDVRRLVFRRSGRPHRLLVVTDVSRALREEERRAWRRLIRVLGHEINNSLGPIQSTAGLLKERSATADATWKDGLELIERRCATLGSFIRRYAELARLPAPCPEPAALSPLIRHVVSMENRVTVAVDSDPSAVAWVDQMQLEQALINLVSNAADAALETGGGVRIRCRQELRHWVVEIEDDGPGIAQTENLFVPFFTTKPGGNGIGLILARQIIEAHGGSLRLMNRTGSRGATAILRLSAATRPPSQL
jgi:signal transduction histidine kinase